MARSKKLTLEERIAIDAYLTGMTKKEALITAGFSEKSAVFSRERVKKELERRQERLARKFEVTHDWVTKQLVDIVTAGQTLAKFKRVTPDGKLDWDFTGATGEELALIDSLSVDTIMDNKKNPVKRFTMKISSRQKALDALCRIHGFNKDSLEVREVPLVERLQRGRDRVKKDNDAGS